MFGKKPPQVLVVGAGPVGLSTALGLVRRDVRVQVVDKEYRTGKHSYALALHAGTLQLLEELGVLGDVLEKAYRVRKVGWYENGERRAEMNVSGLHEDHSFVAVMRQADLEGLLENALRDAGVKVTWSHELADLEQHADGVTVQLNKLTTDSVGYGFQTTTSVVAKSKNVEVPYVVGADGHRSMVRRELSIDFPEVGDPQDYAVFEFKTPTDLQHEMRVVMHEQLANVCWPLPGGFCRWSFELPAQSVIHEREKERTYSQVGLSNYPVLSEEHLRELLTERVPWFEGEIDQLRWRMVVRFERRLAESFGSGRVCLAGDAGHLTGPAGVQSMNVGLREGRDLAEILAGILHGKASAEELGGYDQERRAEWQRMLALGVELKARENADPWVAAHRAALLSCTPASGADLDELLGQVGLAF